MIQLLLIEDDAKVARMLTRGLTEENFTVEAIAQGDAGLDRLLSGNCDICILDVQVPGMDGFTVLSRARQEGITTPVIMLTARDAVPDRVRGLNLGADDYLTKPFVFAELIARLQALLRRGVSARGRLREKDLDLDPGARRVYRAGQEIELSAKQFALLELLLRHRGQVLARAMLLRRVWGYGFDTGTNIVEVQIAHLRQKIDRPGEPSLIHTVRGVGYRMGDGDAL